MGKTTIEKTKPAPSDVARINGRFAEGHIPYRNGGRKGKSVILYALSFEPTVEAQVWRLITIAWDPTITFADRMHALQIMFDALEPEGRKIRYKIPPPLEDSALSDNV
jgi:hypothetical protein